MTVGLATTREDQGLKAKAQRLAKRIMPGRDRAGSVYRTLDGHFKNDRRAELLGNLMDLAAPSAAEKRRNLLEDRHGNEHSNAFALLRDITTNGDTSVSGAALKVILAYVEDNREGLAAGSSQQQKQREQALKTLETCFKATDPRARAAAVEKLAKQTGYLYTDRKDDKLQKDGAEDSRLIGFYENLATRSGATQILFDLLQDETATDFLELNSSLKADLLGPNPQSSLKNDSNVMKSLREQKEIANPRVLTAATTKIGFLKRFEPVTVADDGEREFLASLDLAGVNAEDFNFDVPTLNAAIFNLDRSDVREDAEYNRDELVNNVTAAYFLLVYRSRQADTKLAASTISARQARAIKKEARKQMSLMQRLVNGDKSLDVDGDIDNVLDREFRAKLPNLLFNSTEAMLRIEALSLEGETASLVGDARDIYGEQMLRLADSGNLPTNYGELDQLCTEVQDRQRGLARNIAEANLGAVVPGEELLDFNRVDNALRVIKSWTPDLDAMKVSITDPGAVGAQVQAALERALITGEAPPDVYDSDEATRQFKADLTTCPDTDVQYLMDNWDSVFGTSLADFRFGSPEDRYNIGFNTEKALARFDADDRRTLLKDRMYMGGTIEARVRSDEYDSSITRIATFNTDALTREERVLRTILDNFHKADQDGEVLDSVHSNQAIFTRLLLAEDRKLEETTGSDKDSALRISALMELARQVENQPIDAGLKESTLNHISVELLGLDHNALSGHWASLNAHQGTRRRDIPGIIRENRTAPVDDFATVMQLEFMKLDLVENGLGQLRDNVMEEREATLKHMIEGFYGEGAKYEDNFIQQLVTGLAENGEDQIDSMREALAKLNAAKTDDERQAATVEFLKLLDGSFMTRSIREDLGMLTDDDYIMQVPGRNSLVLNSSNGPEVFSEFVKLWQYILELITGKQSEEKSVPANEQTQDYRRKAYSPAALARSVA